jgi:hypothetical protein
VLASDDSRKTVAAAPPAPPAAAVVPTAPAVAPELWDSTITFFINGVEYTLTNPDPLMHLVDFIRDVALLKGTKVRVASTPVAWVASRDSVWGCGCVDAVCVCVCVCVCVRLRVCVCVCAWQIGCYEGGCGACTVVLSWQDSKGE